jgi:adenosylhomocysteine nucleosidase
LPLTAEQSSVFLYTALPCEARPLIDYYRLKKETTLHAFSVHRNGAITLTITGIGKTAMAAGVAYTHAKFHEPRNPVILNIGIAGHRNENLGALFLADKITDADIGRHFYPPLAFTLPCSTLALQTHAKPQSCYPETALCDMEGSAFYETATRFSTGELCHCLKVVSDNSHTPSSAIDAARATGLIADNLDTITAIVLNLTQMQGVIGHEANNLPLFDDINQRYRLTVSQQLQLKKLLIRLAGLNSENRLDIGSIEAINGKEFLLRLNQQLDALPYQL